MSSSLHEKSSSILVRFMLKFSLIEMTIFRLTSREFVKSSMGKSSMEENEPSGSPFILLIFHEIHIEELSLSFFTFSLKENFKSDLSFCFQSTIGISLSKISMDVQMFIPCQNTRFII
jgi:hypothetical protein